MELEKPIKELSESILCLTDPDYESPHSAPYYYYNCFFVMYDYVREVFRGRISSSCKRDSQQEKYEDSFNTIEDEDFIAIKGLGSIGPLIGEIGKIQKEDVPKRRINPYLKKIIGCVSLVVLPITIGIHSGSELGMILHLMEGQRALNDSLKLLSSQPSHSMHTAKLRTVKAMVSDWQKVSSTLMFHSVVLLFAKSCIMASMFSVVVKNTPWKTAAPVMFTGTGVLISDIIGYKIKRKEVDKYAENACNAAKLLLERNSNKDPLYSFCT